MMYGPKPQHHDRNLFISRQVYTTKRRFSQRTKNKLSPSEWYHLCLVNGINSPQGKVHIDVGDVGSKDRIVQDHRKL